MRNEENIVEVVDTANEITKKKAFKDKVVTFFLNALVLAVEVVAVLALVFLTNKYVAQRTVVDGSSMESTYSDGDNLVVFKLAYKLADPERGDVIVFPHENVFYIKRIVGLPGDHVQIDEIGNLHINGELQRERYASESMDYAGIAEGDGIVLGEDEYFCLGDNRNNSMDSRFEEVGTIQRDDIVGKIVLNVLPW